MTRALPPLLLATALLLVAPPVSRAEEAAAPPPGDAASEADVRRLLDLTGSGSLGVQVGRQLLQALRGVVAGAPEEFWKAVEAKLRPDDLVSMVVPIYRKRLTAQDVKELIAFYESPVGRKLVRALPEMVQESMAAGQVWGQSIAREVIEEAKARGYTVKT